MCDTIAVLAPTSTDFHSLLAKNSDREPNEAQLLTIVPRRTHTEQRLKTTYIEVDQVRETNAVLLCRPFWMWGAEMGVNEYSVAIGNEAVFTRGGYGKTGLTGMDLLRLALERCDSARSAVDVIITLLEQYGQGGNCGFTRQFFYNNSFLIADTTEAWILETVGKQWARKKVSGTGAISNLLTIGSDWDELSPRAEAFAEQKHLRRGKDPMDFAASFSDPLFTRFSRARTRRASSVSALGSGASATVATMQAALRQHDDPDYTLSTGSVGSVCMHFGGIVGDQTVGSMVADLDKSGPVAWVTGASGPCIALFKPITLDAEGAGMFGEDQQDEALNYWLENERISRDLQNNYAEKHEAIERVRAPLEQRFERIMAGAAAEHRKQAARECFELEKEYRLAVWKAIQPLNHATKHSPMFSLQWRRENRELVRRWPAYSQVSENASTV
jgi:secernin